MRSVNTFEFHSFISKVRNSVVISDVKVVSVYLLLFSCLRKLFAIVFCGVNFIPMVKTENSVN